MHLNGIYRNIAHPLKHNVSIFKSYFLIFRLENIPPK